MIRHSSLPVRTVGLFLLLLIQRELAATQGTLIPILENGPTDRYINIVILAEGYTQNQLERFYADATTSTNALLQTMAFWEYRAYFNSYAIAVASNDSGSDHPSRGIYRDTYFNSTYETSGITRLLTIDGTGSQRAYMLLMNLMPEYDIVIILVNDPEYGGSGGAFAVASTNQSVISVVRHEVGHSFARLGDEYSDAGGGPSEHANTTSSTDRHSIKWNRWILDETPIPTPQTSEYAAVIGLFEGAEYRPTGWYRPKLNCQMRSLYIPFCEVCDETIVKSMYRAVRPIDDHTPAQQTVGLEETETQTFTLDLKSLLSHTFTIRWFVDGIEQPGAVSATFSTSMQGLGEGSHTVMAVVHDSTTFVRNDPSGLLCDSVSWIMVPAATQEIPLRQGWSFVSSYIAPKDTNIENILSSVSNQLTVVCTDDGGKYSPSVPFNTIGSWKGVEGYKIKMTSQATMKMTGLKLSPSGTPLSLTKGWNLVPYLISRPMRVDSTLSHFNFIRVVKNQDARVCIPSMGLDHIGSMRPGEAYYFFAASGQQFSYPEDSIGRSSPPGPEGATPSAELPDSTPPWFYTNTGSSHSILISAVTPHIGGNDISTGDFLGVFYDSAGVLACGGYGQWNGGTTVIPAFGDDSTTLLTKDGFAAGESFKWKIWRLQDKGVFDAVASYRRIGGWAGLVTDTNNYVENGISALASLDGTVSSAAEPASPFAFILYQNYPNPFNPKTGIRCQWPVAGRVRLVVYDLLGREVTTLLDADMEAGDRLVEFDASGLSSGVYICRFTAGAFAASQKLLLAK